MSEHLSPNKFNTMLDVALAEARLGLSEGGIPIGAAIFNSKCELISSGHNRRVQEGDPSIHGETDAFRRAGRQTCYRDLTRPRLLPAGIAVDSSGSLDSGVS